MEFDSGGGYDFPVDPLIPPPEAPVFWLPQEDTSVVILANAPSEFDEQIGLAATVIWRAHPRSQPTDEDYRLDIGNGQHLQILDCTAGDDRIAVAIVPLGLDGFDVGRQARLGLAFRQQQAQPEGVELGRMALAPQDHLPAELRFPLLEGPPDMPVRQSQHPGRAGDGALVGHRLQHVKQGVLDDVAGGAVLQAVVKLDAMHGEPEYLDRKSKGRTLTGLPRPAGRDLMPVPPLEGGGPVVAQACRG